VVDTRVNNVCNHLEIFGSARPYEALDERFRGQECSFYPTIAHRVEPLSNQQLTTLLLTLYVNR